MNDPLRLLRDRLTRVSPGAFGEASVDRESPDPLQMLTAEILLFTGLGTVAEALHDGQHSPVDPYAPESGPRGAFARLRPVDWGPALLAAAAAIAHAVHAIAPGERSRLATRTFDLAVVGIGLLGLADTLAGVRRGGRPLSPAPLSLASAALLGILVDRAERQHEDERKRLEKRARIVERLVPKRRPRLDRIVVHV